MFTDGRYRLMLVRDGEPLISVDEMFVRLQQDLSQARAELEVAYQELGRLRSERANRAARAALGIGDDPEGRSGKPRLHLVPKPAPDGDG